jgi:hypothetical protein
MTFNSFFCEFRSNWQESIIRFQLFETNHGFATRFLAMVGGTENGRMGNDGNSGSADGATGLR